ncbi:hypothetical protein B0J13DRAFT_483420 [Dactylonectria estremocensis]|uniref:Zn(2)-C6 fungal-type domain-containing protein n=1 Tax=Dactylonectria estremocensis TaxID=1079267 RepID=A0A9P9E0T7_9HYPO|nr:hypothetical protein B0J13DRAFT_483420 [Dactylonectria estremocensis]
MPSPSSINQSLGPEADDVTGLSRTSYRISTARQKRRRLNFACNYCRNRKTRCDEQRPSCGPCIAAGVVCMTEDRRKPGRMIERREAGVLSSSGMSITSQLAAPERTTTSSEQQSTLRRASNVGDCAVGRTGHTDGFSQTASLSPPPSLPRDPSISESQAYPSNTARSRKYTGALPIWRQTSGATHLEILTEWLDLAFHRLSIPHRIGVGDSSRNFTPQPSLLSPVVNLAHPFPNVDTCEALLGTYLQEVNAIFPIFRATRTQQEVRNAQQLGAEGYALAFGYVSLLRIYLLLAAGAIARQAPDKKTWVQQTLKLGRDYLGHLVGTISLEAVDVLFLLSMCLKLNDEVTSAWSTLGLCISCCYSLGLNRLAVTRYENTTSPEDLFKRQKWWAIYSFEKLFSFELGYASCIIDECYDNMDPVPSQSEDGEMLSDIMTSFAKVLSQVSRRCVQARQKEEAFGQEKMDVAIAEKVKATGQSTLQLLEWANSLPANYRPASDMIHGCQNFELTTFISLQYNNALLMLTRNTLLISKNALRIAVEVIAKDTPWHFVVRNGHSLAINSARRIIKVLAEAEDSLCNLSFHSYHSSLHAFYILGVHILRQPHTRMAKADLNLMTVASEFARSRYSYVAGQNLLEPILCKVLRVVNEALESKQPTPKHHTRLEVGSSRQQELPPDQDMSSSITVADNTSPYRDTSLSETSFPQSISETSMMGHALGGPLTHLDPSDGQPSPRLADEIGYDWTEFVDLFSSFSNHAMLMETSTDQLNDLL